MLQLTVVAPDKRKADIACEPSATFGDVKAKVQEAFSVPPDKQRLLCNGKERKNDGETLAAAKVSAKCKIMLMLAPGYTMPAAPGPGPAPDAAGARACEPPQECAGGAPPVDAELELPLPAGAAGAAAEGMVHVRQGRNRYHVRVPHGLHAATFRDLADRIAQGFFPDVPGEELCFVCRGKRPQLSDPLGPEGSHEVSVMLLFHGRFHKAEENSTWLRERTAELEDIELLISKLGRRIEANFSNEETAIQLAEALAVVETMVQSLDSVAVRGSVLPEMQRFRERTLAAKGRLEELKMGTRI
mmetsp:Transcript_113564/g.321587  ORF Transcript_113564/g.321587 Transcript_113564/m.321587 type:complete len:301 (-) Transcript_113564:68-970(-)